MGLRAAVRFLSGSRPVATLMAIVLTGMATWGLAGDDETVVVHLIATLDEAPYTLTLDPTADPAVEILPCYPPNRPFLGAATDPVLVGRIGDATVFEGRWIDPSRFLVEPPDDGDAALFTPPSQVAVQLTLPWTGEFEVLDIFASPADRDLGAPALQVATELQDAISSYLERGGRERTDVLCQDPEVLDARRDAIDTVARSGEALKQIGADDPR